MMGKAKILIIGACECTGGGGIEADLASIRALGGVAFTVLTAVIAEDGNKGHVIHALPPSFVARQLEILLDEFGADCIKTGLLPNAEIIETVATVLEGKAKSVPLVVDPVLKYRSGVTALDQDGVAALKRSLLVRAALVTPNLDEARTLSARETRDANEIEQCAEILLTLGPRAVLLKGGRLPGDQIKDYLITENSNEAFDHPRIDLPDWRGAGCTLASAIATGIGQGLPVAQAVERGLDHLRGAMRHASAGQELPRVVLAGAGVAGLGRTAAN
jgi:hydroxymethylpyrimidine/phosphomethylpyrimidine kinase